MKAIVLNEPGSVENLVIRDVPVPQLKQDEVFVRVKSISINPVDVKTRIGSGIYNSVRNASPLILGWDVSGVITESKSSLFKAGDEVFGMVNFPGVGNAYAEFVAVPATHLALKPTNLSQEEAAAATLALLTAWQAMTTVAGIKKGDRVLIPAASGGVGHYAVQIAKHIGAYVIATSSAVNKDFVLSLGADEHIDYQTQTLKDTVSNIDFVLDSLGAENVDQSLDVMRPAGKVITLVAKLNEALMQKASLKNLSISNYLVKSDGKDMNMLAKLLATGEIKSHVSKTFAFDQMREAHLQIESGRTVGKIIVNV